MLVLNAIREVQIPLVAAMLLGGSVTKLARTLEATKGFVLSEAVMLALAKRIGKQSAHTLVYETAMAAHSTGRGLKVAILDNPQIGTHLSTKEIESLFDYRRHTGHCGAMVDQVLAELRNVDEPG